MAVRYVRVNPVSDMFSPAVRAFGNVAIVGPVTPPAAPPEDLLAVGDAVVFTDPSEARRRAPGALGDAIALAFAQSPGPLQVTGVRVDSAAPDWVAGLDVLGTHDVQLVAVAGAPLDAAAAAAGGSVHSLVDHVVSVSNTGGDGKERMGVAMLEKGASDPTVVAGSLAHERMVYVAHKSDEDVAAAVAGAIAGYPPNISMVLKQINVDSDPFTSAEIDQLNGTEGFGSGPAGMGVNWLVDPPLIPGQGIYLGDGYTGNPGGKKYIDVVRTVDDVSFRLKAQLIRSIGNVRVTRSGLRALIAQLEAVLTPLVQQAMIDDFTITVPILALLDRPPASLSAAELQQINDAQTQRFAQVLVELRLAGGLERVDISMVLV